MRGRRSSVEVMTLTRVADRTTDPFEELYHGEYAPSAPCGSIWLEAGRANEKTNQTKAANSVALLEKGASSGWSKDSDILVEAQTLLDAMLSGDTKTVTVAPDGGCP